jgi:Uma2 family endonuclease
MSLHEIVLPETKPETEWVRGRALQKMSPTYSHARLQFEIASALTTWAERGRHGRVGTEWRFRVTPPGQVTRPLVPDVGYLSYETLAADAPAELVEIPLAAPTVAVEILSPGDRPRDVDDKIHTYLSAGTSAIIVVDPIRTTIRLHDACGVQHYGPSTTVTHTALPGFILDVGALFARARSL